MNSLLQANRPLLRRPNGRPQACEPCRRRKVSCDNRQPKCMRCLKRGQADECVYVTSGMPRPGSATRKRPSDSAGSSDSSPVPHSSKRLGRNSEMSDSFSPNRTGGSRTGTPGYLGFTSFSAVFEETQISLNSLQGAAGRESSAFGTDSQETTVAPDNTFDFSPRTRDVCLYILRNVPDAWRGKVCLRGSPTDSWVYYFLVLESFYATYGRYFGPDKSEAALEELACIISKNTTRPFSDADDLSFTAWMAQLSGPNTRWETLGLLFAFWDFSVNSITINKSCTQDEYGRPSPVTKECLDFCVDLCNEFSRANSMILYLSYKRLILETLINGDISRQSWIFMSEAVALITYLGYHVLPDTPDYRPTFTSEIKRKLYYSIYIIHMSLVSLTGRPPLMSKRFHTTPIPLDLPNMSLFSRDENALVEAPDHYDPVTGWDKYGRKLASMPMRCRAKIALLREDILDLALGPKQYASIEALLDLKARETRMFDELPEAIKFQETDLADPNIEMGVFYYRLLISLEHFLNQFFIERLLLKYGHMENELLSVSFEMVRYTLLFWTHQDHLSPWRCDFEWIIIAFGVPAGGILCQELLKPSVHNKTHITRSNLTQKLSLLVAFLDWIKPTAPNGDLCGKCKAIIKHVLDQALNAPAGQDNSDGLAFDWDISAQLDFDFDLLDTFNWTRSDFPLSQQSNV
ncbi:hypothetical protein F5Y16DRAFT_408161 [Xylariaceae sp. FL0255]|nr:hypothetical protein F5Y16DRAFT_408161 [Xylariaceae sp. FL0255]